MGEKTLINSDPRSDDLVDRSLRFWKHVAEVEVGSREVSCDVHEHGRRLTGLAGTIHMWDLATRHLMVPYMPLHGWPFNLLTISYQSMS